MTTLTVTVTTAKQAMTDLIALAEQVLEHDARIKGTLLDDAELADADTEDAFEEVRTALVAAKRLVAAHVD